MHRKVYTLLRLLAPLFYLFSPTVSPHFPKLSV